MTMDKTYQPHQIEKKWYQHWEKSGFFSSSVNQAEKTYCIILPPPNVTGTLHMGHAFQDTVMDMLIRTHRMQGVETLWQGGTDHAGIATQMVVERQLLKEGTAKKNLSREQFIDKIWQWKEQSGGMISKQMRRLGASIDWTRERFTMDESSSKAVQTAFIQLYDEGIIYRGKRLVNWDPKFHTAVSDLEVITEETDGFLWHIRYPLVDGTGHMVVATTRPETMLGDVAVAVNPKDERYQHLIGKKLTLPLCNREIPIIADDYVLADFGTGCVKITPAHDFNDHQIGKRHNLEMINILTDNADINDNAPKAYQGLNRFVAREQIIKDLEALNLIEKIEDYKVMLPIGDRSGEIIEPYLTDQWFVDAKKLAGPAIDVVEKGKIQFIPEHYTKTYFDWMYNIEDWCISRQIWWGHRIPAWYDESGNIYVGESEQAVRAKHQLGPDLKLHQEEDVLDTWFSSALWPFSTLGWPNSTEELAKFYPTSVLVTGFDIIFFWVARMIMMGMKFMNDVPFHTVYVHGLIQDAKGQKMSKSKGNIIDPLDLIDGITLDDLLKKRTENLMQPQMAKKIANETQKEYPEGIASFGTDALRFAFCALASNARFIRFDLARVEGARHFCNKIWNASRYVLMNVSEKQPANVVTLYDKWIWSTLQHTKQQINTHMAEYRFDLVAQVLYDFIWSQYCDWYLELSKPVLNEDFEAALKDSTRYTLIAVLDEILKLLHPIMPFITEEIWQKLGDQNGSLMLQSYPPVDEKLIDKAAEQQISWVQAFITGIRSIRGEMRLNPTQPLEVICQGEQALIQQTFETEKTTLCKLAKVADIRFAKTGDTLPVSASFVIDEMTILIPLAGLIDKEAESKRLTKEMDKLKKEIAMFQGKLANENYVNKAPVEIVNKEKERLQHAENTLKKLADNYDKVNAL